MLKARAKLLQKYLCDEQKELQALYALQALVVTLEQPPRKSQAGGLGVGWKNRQKAGTVMERWVVIGEQNALMVDYFPLECLFPCLHMGGVRLSLEGVTTCLVLNQLLGIRNTELINDGSLCQAQG